MTRTETEGEEIQIDSTDDPDSTTGAIYNEQAADAAARDAALNPDGEWNEYEIRVEADRIIVFLNGTKINEWTEDDPNVDLAQGYIGIQNYGVDDDVFFRNIRISEGTTNTAPVATDGKAESNTATVTIDVTAGKPTKPPRGG